MRLFAKKRSGPGTAVQLRAGQRHPFGVFDGYVPLGGGEDRLYRTIREAVPVLDAAILKIIRLAGGFSVRCGEPAAETALNEFLRTVNVGRGQAGFDAFLDQYLDSMAALGDFTVTSGDSQWSVLKRFCRFAGGVRPRFAPDGVLLLNGQDGAARAIGPGTAVTAAVIRDSRYGVISEVLVKNKARGSAETVKNAAYLARGVRCRRVLAVPRRTGGDAMK